MLSLSFPLQPGKRGKLRLRRAAMTSAMTGTTSNPENTILMNQKRNKDEWRNPGEEWRGKRMSKDRTKRINQARVMSKGAASILQHCLAVLQTASLSLSLFLSSLTSSFYSPLSPTERPKLRPCGGRIGLWSLEHYGSDVESE